MAGQVKSIWAFFGRMFRNKEQSESKKEEKFGVPEFIKCSYKPLGFIFEHPSNWFVYPSNLIDFNNNALATMGVMTVSMFGDPTSGPDKLSPRISMIIERRSVNHLKQGYNEFLSKHSKNTKILEHRMFTLSSGEEALEWSYEFIRESQKFRAVGVLVVKHDRVYRLIGSCLKAQFKNLEQTFLKIVRSLSFQ
jgi:hypothetical protein